MFIQDELVPNVKCCQNLEKEEKNWLLYSFAFVKTSQWIKNKSDLDIGNCIMSRHTGR